MTRFRAAVAALLLLGLAAATAGGTYAARADNDNDGDRRIAMRDDCDPSPAGGWNPAGPPNPPGGCLRKRGNVSTAEFEEELISPNAVSVVGHQAWRNDPSYLVIESGQSLRVKNAGGRPHTFTETSEFGAGGGNPPHFNTGLTPTTPPACPGAVIAAGDSVKLSGLSLGNHRCLCCIHPWMRALVKVKPKHSGVDDDD